MRTMRRNKEKFSVTFSLEYLHKYIDMCKREICHVFPVIWEMMVDDHMGGDDFTGKACMVLVVVEQTEREVTGMA